MKENPKKMSPTKRLEYYFIHEDRTTSPEVYSILPRERVAFSLANSLVFLYTYFNGLKGEGEGKRVSEDMLQKRLRAYNFKTLEELKSAVDQFRDEVKKDLDTDVWNNFFKETL